MLFAIAAANRDPSAYPDPDRFVLSTDADPRTGSPLIGGAGERVHELFDVPSEMRFHACVPLGYPRGRFGTTQRLPTAATTYGDRWGDAPPWADT